MDDELDALSRKLTETRNEYRDAERNFVEAVATATQTPVDLAAMLALAVVAAYEVEEAIIALNVLRVDEACVAGVHGLG
jgi:hypothetical protein